MILTKNLDKGFRNFSDSIQKKQNTKPEKRNAYINARWIGRGAHKGRQWAKKVKVKEQITTNKTKKKIQRKN